MKINLLHDEFYSKEYTLFAIKSNLQDYRLAYFFNKKTDLDLNRMTKDVKYTLKNNTIYFSAFVDKSFDDKKKCFLISNKTIYSKDLKFGSLFKNIPITNNMFLIPELKEFDYMLKLDGIWTKKEIEDLVTSMSKISEILANICVDSKKIKSINNLIL
tara:strand:+ start:215 stop:688 length:474 start_codon:yes stop_codon:yes gene_type:complete